jgi:putative transposase
MSVKPSFNSDYFYFVTTTAVRHIRLFRQDVIFHHLRIIRAMKLFVFVIMPNHIHAIIHFSEEYPLSDMMRDFKKYTARQIHRQFVIDGNSRVLGILRKEGERVKQEYKVWEDSYDARDVFSIKFLQQKMDYIHHNPCQPQWKLVKSPEEYLWSTARFYLDGKPCVIPVDDVREFLV